ncbi:hypothetical protein [Tumebacillus permanentifrigoris]|uniref:LysM domain-containing protein n=1 Tax=Tumebacillus permanentifrigoris TaxID=378543 RepID=A0A316DFV9_9BACL|nr:hypothetical protein [Tumebacillus permanentifrigoris]PWK16498.1 hypothetical protein C7459_101362 [Tumebacillus permanentifrigoris]
MKKYTKYAVALATVVALGGSATFAMAATTDKSATTTTQGTQQNQQGKGKGHGGPQQKEMVQQNTELQALLKLTADELTTQLKAGKSLADIATAQGVDKQQVIDLLVKQDAARIDQDVKDGKLTADKATEMKANSTQRATDRVDGKGGFGGGPGGDKGFHGGGHGFDVAQNTELTSLLKLTADELTTQLKAGKSLADIAAAQSVDKQQVIDLLVKLEAAHFDQEVTDGKMTAEQAAACKANSVQHVTDQVDGKGGFGGGPGAPGGERGGRGGHGFGEFDQATADFLKVTQDELKTQLQAGKSLLEIATAHSVTKEQLTSFLVDKQTKQLDQDLKDQKITQAQYDEMKTHIADMVEHMLAGKPAKGDRGPRGQKQGQAQDQTQQPAQQPTTQQ